MKLPVKEYHSPGIKPVIEPAAPRALVRLGAPTEQPAGPPHEQLLQQLRTAQKFLSEERDERAKERAQYEARIVSLQRASIDVIASPSLRTKPSPDESPPRRISAAWVLAGTVVVVCLAVLLWVFFPVDLATGPVTTQLVNAPAVQQTMSGEEAQALGRFEDAVADVPRIAVPGLLFEVNRRLTQVGANPCVEPSADGGFSLVLGRSDARPLLDALSRCSDAVEKITK